jgi:hypothetical protein
MIATPTKLRVALVVVSSALLTAAAVLPTPQGERVLEARRVHLGNDVVRDWPETTPEPQGTVLELKFDGAANAAEWTLFVDQRSIDGVWRLKANGVEFARLKAAVELQTRAYAVPAGAFVAGANVLSFEPDDPKDDVVIGAVRLVERSQRELYSTRPVRVRVRDAESNEALPARVSVVDAAGKLAPIYYGESQHTAVRAGVIYVGPQGASFELAAGKYTVHATRGAEWSLATRALELGADGAGEVELELRREVDTRGFAAADTHIHTLQFSGHGDASAEERQVTLAGEGVELAIATDHNHNIDYVPFQRALGLSRYYTAVVGNEVTTKVGHFNGFPLRATDEIPPHKLEDYVKIVDGIRAKGAQVVILNHPRWPSHTDSPFGNHHLDHLLGRFDPPLALPVDATELINATTEELEPTLLFRDWFALLNRGVRIFAVGSSDSHTVGEPVGQGRTYFPSPTDDPAQLDVDAACQAIKNGRTSIGMGLFATVEVDGRWRMGDTAQPARAGEPLKVALRVQAPSWIRAREVQLFVNGVEREKRAFSAAQGKPTDERFEFVLAAPPHDAWIVCVATGDAAQGLHWPQTNPYTLAATNPVFVDVDGDGWTSPADSARAWLSSKPSDAELRAKLAGADEALRVHTTWAAAENAPQEQRLERARSLLGDPRSDAERELLRRLE